MLPAATDSMAFFDDASHVFAELADRYATSIGVELVADADPVVDVDALDEEPLLPQALRVTPTAITAAVAAIRADTGPAMPYLRGK